MNTENIKLNQGDTIEYNGKTMYVVNPDYTENTCWVTDSKEHINYRYAPGWEVNKKDLIPLTEDLNEEIPEAPEGDASGIVQMISDLTQEEFQASDHYNSAIATLRALKRDDIAELLTEIRADEESHIGVLHAAKALLDEQTAVKFPEGQEEAAEIFDEEH